MGLLDRLPGIGGPEDARDGGEGGKGDGESLPDDAPHSLPPGVLERVRFLEVRARELVDTVFSGEYRSLFRGRGIELSEVRRYQIGDDVRTIDWNVTARRGRPYVKRFVEERELSVVLLVDLSGSTKFGTGTKSNRDVAVEIAAVLTLSAIRNNDRVGLLLVTDRVERFVPRGSGRRHGLRLLRELLTWRPESRDTDLSDGLAHVARAFPRRSIVFLISDFVLAGPISDRFRDLFLRVSSRHDLIPVWLTDSRSEILPDLGWIRLADPETGESAIVDSGSREVREEYRKAIRARRAEVSALFGRACVDPVEVETKEDYVKPLVSFFRRAARAIP